MDRDMNQRSREIGPGMAELIGRRCECEFTSARRPYGVVIVEAIALPMIKVRYERPGDPARTSSYWINVSQILTLRQLDPTENAAWTTT